MRLIAPLLRIVELHGVSEWWIILHTFLTHVLLQLFENIPGLRFLVVFEVPLNDFVVEAQRVQDVWVV